MKFNKELLERKKKTCHWKTLIYVHTTPMTDIAARRYPVNAGSNPNFDRNNFEINTTMVALNKSSKLMPKELNRYVQFIRRFLISGKRSRSLGVCTPSAGLKCPWRMCFCLRSLAPGISRGNPRISKELKITKVPKIGKPSHQAPIHLGSFGVKWSPEGCGKKKQNIKLTTKLVKKIKSWNLFFKNWKNNLKIH